jgi:hypothetical protein
MEINVSSQPLRMGWVLGWAIPQTWFEAKVIQVFPQVSHTFINSSEDVLDEINKHAPYDHLIGYSLGALLLLTEKEKIINLAKCFTLLAPILAFTNEMELGGITPRVNLQIAKRALKQNQEKACIDFYKLTHLDVPDILIDSLEKNDLTWGLEQLETRAYTSQVPSNWKSYVGGNDPLLNVDLLLKSIPHLKVIHQAGHEPDNLLLVMKEALI